MKILILGAGSIGGFFGGKLLNAGRDVTFLVRERRAKQLEEFGLVIERSEGPLVVASPPTVTKDQLRSPYDCIIVACKAYDLGPAMEDVSAAIGPNTQIIPLLNGMRHMDVLDAYFGAEKVLGGLCVVSTTLGENGKIVQMGPLQSLTIGSRNRSGFQQAHEITATFENAGFDFIESDDILQDMWNKWVFIATAAALTSVMRASVGDVIQAGGANCAERLLHECIMIAEAHGHRPDDETVFRYLRMFTTPGSPLTASLFRDMENRHAIEADAIIGDLLMRKPPKSETPILDISHLVMRSYEARRLREAARPG